MFPGIAIIGFHSGLAAFHTIYWIKIKRQDIAFVVLLYRTDRLSPGKLIFSSPVRPLLACDHVSCSVIKFYLSFLVVCDKILQVSILFGVMAIFHSLYHCVMCIRWSSCFRSVLITCIKNIKVWLFCIFSVFMSPALSRTNYILDHFVVSPAKHSGT